MVSLRQFTIGSFGSPAGLSMLTWDGASRSLDAVPIDAPVGGTLALAARADGRVLLIAPFDDEGELVVLLRADAASAFVVARRLRLPGVRQPCRVRLSEDGRSAAIAGYGSGTLTIVALDDAGLPSAEPCTSTFAGSGADPDRQDRSYVHDALFAADAILAADLGADLIRVVDGGERAPIVCPPGSGPRHIADAGNGFLVVSGELDSTLLLIGPGPAGVRRLADVAPAAAATRAGRNHPSSVVVDTRSGLVHVANRGADTVTTAAVRDGRLSVLAEVPTGGASPEHLVVEGDHLFVAHSGDGIVTALPLRRGVPTGEVSAAASVPGAMWIEPLGIASVIR